MTDARLEAVIAAVRYRNPIIKEQVARDFLAMYDAARAFDEPRQRPSAREHLYDVPQCWCGYSHRTEQQRKEVVRHEQPAGNTPRPDNVSAPLVGADPPWLNEAIWKVCEIVSLPASACAKCEASGYICPRWRVNQQAVRAVLAVAARQPRPITEAMVEAAARALYREQYRPEEELTKTNLDATFAATVHDGDCTGKSYTCFKCEADQARRSARAALEAAKKARQQ